MPVRECVLGNRNALGVRLREPLLNSNYLYVLHVVVATIFFFSFGFGLFLILAEYI